jgi:uridine nucleosidase
MYSALNAQPKNTAWLVATGCLTNIAALFAAHPDLVSHIAGLSIMGGAVGNGFTSAPMGVVTGDEGQRRFGNWTPWAEFNIYIDPESAQAVFGNEELAKKTTLVTLDLTHQFLATEEVQEGLLYGFTQTERDSKDQPSEVRRLFIEILTFFAKTYADVFGLVEGPPVHDPLAVAALLPGLLQYSKPGESQEERFQVEVIIEGDHGADIQARSGGSQCGRTVVTKLPKGEEGVRIPRALQTANMWRVLESCLGRAEKELGR